MNAWKRIMAAAGMGIMLMASSVYGAVSYTHLTLPTILLV